MKKVFVISAVMLMAVSAVFVSCKKKNSDNPSNGCTCKVYDPDYDEYETWNVTKEDMQYEGVSSCSALAAMIREDGYFENVSCK